MGSTNNFEKIRFQKWNTRKWWNNLWPTPSYAGGNWNSNRCGEWGHAPRQIVGKRIEWAEPWAADGRSYGGEESGGVKKKVIIIDSRGTGLSVCAFTVGPHLTHEFLLFPLFSGPHFCIARLPSLKFSSKGLTHIHRAPSPYPSTLHTFCFLSVWAGLCFFIKALCPENLIVKPIFNILVQNFKFCTIKKYKFNLYF